MITISGPHFFCLVDFFYHTGYHPGLHPGVILGVCRPRARKNRHPIVILALRFELPASTVTAQSSWYHPGRRLGGPCLLSLHVLLSVIRLSTILGAFHCASSWAGSWASSCPGHTGIILALDGLRIPMPQNCPIILASTCLTYRCRPSSWHQPAFRVLVNRKTE